MYVKTGQRTRRHASDDEDEGLVVHHHLCLTVRVSLHWWLVDFNQTIDVSIQLRQMQFSLSLVRLAWTTSSNLFDIREKKVRLFSRCSSQRRNSNELNRFQCLINRLETVLKCLASSCDLSPRRFSVLIACFLLNRCAFFLAVYLSNDRRLNSFNVLSKRCFHHRL